MRNHSPAEADADAPGELVEGARQPRAAGQRGVDVGHALALSRVGRRARVEEGDDPVDDLVDAQVGRVDEHGVVGLPQRAVGPALESRASRSAISALVCS